MRKEVIEIPSRVIAFARRINPDNPKKLVKVLIELTLEQELEIGALILSEDQIVIESFPDSSDDFVRTIVNWYLNNETEFFTLIKGYGLTKVKFDYEDNDSDNSFLSSSLMVITVKT